MLRHPLNQKKKRKRKRNNEKKTTTTLPADDGRWGVDRKHPNRGRFHYYELPSRSCQPIRQRDAAQRTGISAIISYFLYSFFCPCLSLDLFIFVRAVGLRRVATFLLPRTLQTVTIKRKKKALHISWRPPTPIELLKNWTGPTAGMAVVYLGALGPGRTAFYEPVAGLTQLNRRGPDDSETTQWCGTGFALVVLDLSSWKS